MMTIRWSWFFILHALLVRPGSAHHDSQNTDATNPRGSIVQVFARSFSSSKKRNLAVPIAVGVIAGVALLIALIFFFLYWRPRKHSTDQVENGVVDEKPQWWHIDLHSAKRSSWLSYNSKGETTTDEKSSPDESGSTKTKISHLDRLRFAFTWKSAVKTQGTDSSNRRSLTPSPTDSIPRPLPVAINHHSRHPSFLERPGNPPDFPPPTPIKNFNLARAVLAGETEKSHLRRMYAPPKVPKALHGRLVPGLSDRKAGMSKSPSSEHRRRSWFSKQHLKNPFLPLKESDAVLPSSVSAGLALRQKLVQSPHSRTVPATSPPNAPHIGKVKRVPAPIYEAQSTMPSHDAVMQAHLTGGVPRPKYQADQRVMRSALPLGYKSRPPANPTRI